MKLPLNCSVEYFRNFLTEEEALSLYQEIKDKYQIAQFNKMSIQQKEFVSETGKINFVDPDLFETIKASKMVRGEILIWPAQLRKVKERIEKLTKRRFHVCVAIYYPDGNAGVDYHSDYIAFGDTTVIPSLSTGEERTFLLREKATMKKHELLLEQGSLVVMGENCQERYEHSIPRDSQCTKGRINLTFRTYGHVS